MENIFRWAEPILKIYFHFISDVEVTTQAVEKTKVPVTDAPNNDEYDEVDDSEYEGADNSNGFEVNFTHLIVPPVYAHHMGHMIWFKISPLARK